MNRTFTIQMDQAHHAHWCNSCKTWRRCWKMSCPTTTSGDFRRGAILRRCGDCRFKVAVVFK